MKNPSKITITILSLIIGTLVSLVYLQGKKIYVYQAHNEMQQRAIHKLDSMLSIQDSVYKPIKGQ